MPDHPLLPAPPPLPSPAGPARPEAGPGPATVVNLEPLPREKPIPFHPAASTVLIVVDNLWNLEEWIVIDWILTIPLSFITVFAPTLLIQRKLGGDGWLTALAKALFFGVIAAVPTSVTGTPVGLALLAWAGVRRFGK